MKKERYIVILFLGMALLPLLSSVVSAQYYGIDLKQGAEQITQWIQDMFGPLFSVLLNVSSPEFVFAKVLLAVLLLIIIYIILDRSDLFGGYKTLVIIISVIVSLIAVRYLPEETFIQFILLPYGVLGVSLLSFLPLLIYFFFVENIHDDIMRKIAWGLYAAIFIGLCITRLSDLGDVAYIYLLAAILAILFMIFDKTIQTHVLLRSVSKGLNADKVRAMVSLQKQIKDDQDLLLNAQNRAQRNQLIKSISDNKKALKKLARL
ncbi:hypothetical protein A3K73_04490 [Candidatus Pacearchaeota archaeon RBG_13_36_9]|nr:MAG: hypothetical protein A3K73_04490 [Candidatus Pacearchaeota archaeon RBG_13_36_9]